MEDGRNYSRPAADPNSAKYDVIKSRYDTLVNEKIKIEKRLAELSEVLHQNGDVGLDTPLVDDEGFPRSDIDVALIRITRNNIRCLNTDHKQIMLEIETALHELHEYARQNPSGKCSHQSKQDSNEDRQSEEKSSEVIKTPFLRIDQIAPNSLAEQADLKIGDLVVQFGSVTAKNFSSLQDISTVFKNTPPGSCIQMSIIRGNNVNTVLSVSLLKPAGNASLGLHVVPV
ncbi:unnamed protein product [Trichobilharzia szidati]|nr:unnamed protein product [Trichobilharzia szidati]